MSHITVMHSKCHPKPRHYKCPNKYYIEKNTSNINSRESIDGIILGEGSYGTVLTKPRLPLEHEKIKDLFHYKEVSKIFFNQKDYIFETSFFEKNIDSLTKNITSQYLVFPIKYGNTNKQEIFLYNLVYKGKYYNLNLTDTYKDNDLYHIIFPMGDSIGNYDIYSASSVRTQSDSESFLTNFLNILDCLKLFDKYNLFFPDLKLHNIISINDYNNKTDKHENIFKLIDYTSLLSIDNSEIENTLKSLFNSPFNYFECGFDYPSYPCYPILLLKCLSGQIELEFDLEDIEYMDINQEEIIKFGSIMDEQLFYDDIHIYLINKVSTSNFSGFNNINRMFRFFRHKMIDFSFNIKLFNTSNSQLIDFEINSNNIFLVMYHIYYEKIGYLDDNFEKNKQSLSDIKTSEKSKKKIFRERNKKINEYSLYFCQYIRFFMNSHKNFKQIDIKKLLLKKIQNYSFGIVILNFISNYYYHKNKYDDYFVKMIKIALTACLTQYYDEHSDTWYINLNDINVIQNTYLDVLKC